MLNIKVDFPQSAKKKGNKVKDVALIFWLFKMITLKLY